MSTILDKKNIIIGTTTQIQNRLSTDPAGTIYLATDAQGVSDVTVNGSSVVVEGTAKLTVPTKTSEITNNSGYVAYDTTELTNYYQSSVVDANIAAHHDSEKQDVLNETQLAAVNSGITSDDVASMLKKPSTTPTINELVGVGTSGDQVRIQLGTNLELDETTEPYTLNATGGSGSSKYLHHVQIFIKGTSSYHAIGSYISESATPLNQSTTISSLSNDCITALTKMGAYTSTTDPKQLSYVIIVNSTVGSLNSGLYYRPGFGIYTSNYYMTSSGSMSYSISSAGGTSTPIHWEEWVEEI